MVTQTPQAPALAQLSAVPRQATARLRAASKQTPGQLTWMLAVLVVLSVLLGVVGAMMVTHKQATLGDLNNHREPVTSAAQQIYRSLSDADATAASSFLSAGTAPVSQRRRYQADVAEAGSAIAVAASDFTSGGEADRSLRQLASLLPSYAGLVQTANANNRQGYPVGASYLLEASALMRNTLLPAAEHLYREENAKLTNQQDEATSFPWLSVIIVLALLGVLGYAQLYLRRRTNRLFNIGLGVASAAVVIVTLWGLVGLILVSVHVGTARGQGSDQVAAFTHARIAALNARTDETLALVNRDQAPVYRKQFTAARERLVGTDGKSGLLGDAARTAADTGEGAVIADATSSAMAWFAVHNKLVALDASGQSKAAIELAVGTETAGASARFYQLDGDLQKAINHGRQEFVGATSAARNSLIALDIGLIVGAVIGIGGITVGLWQRLREYR